MPLEEQINGYLLTHPDAKAKEIAQEIGVKSKKVNSYLYKNPQQYVKDAQHRWRIKEPTSSDACETLRENPLLLKLQSHEQSKCFSVDDFEKIADWGNAVSHASDVQEGRFTIWCGPREGMTLPYDSNAEKKLLQYLKNHDLVLDIGAQALCIQYDSPFVEDKDYYPDIVVLTKDNRIAVFEVKPTVAMDNHTNMEKYRALKEYCTEHGYEFMMVDPDSSYCTFEQLLNKRIGQKLHDHFKALEKERERVRRNPDKPYLFFDNETVDQWYKQYGAGLTKKAFQLQVHSLIARYGWYNLYNYGFMVYSRPVRTNNEHEVTGWQ